MADIFISYANADRERARVLADALAERGYSVWWDRTIPPGRVFDEVIQEALQAARCVLVLWSSDSVKSNWVKTEAAEGVAQSKLVPATIEAVPPPIEFRRIQAADLSDWSGSADHPEFRKLLAAIEGLLQGTSSVRQDSFKPPLPTQPSRLTLLKIMALVGAIGIVATVAMRWTGDRAEQDGATLPPRESPSGGQSANAPPESAAAPTLAPSAAGEAVPRSPAAGGRTNLLSPAEGGEIVTASHEHWSQTIDGKEDTYAWVDSGEAVFGFRDGHAASFDTFAVLIPSTSDNNLRDFELLASNAPGGPFESIGVFTTQNIRIMKNPYQEFRFAPVKAKYLKLRSLENHSGSSGAVTGYEFRLYGKVE